MEIYSFKDYMNEPYALDFGQMERLHQDLLSEIENDADAVELYEELVDAATKYTAIRAKWLRMPREEKMSTDPLRTSCHDSVITHFNMLARFLRMQGKKAVWRDLLGDPDENRYHRKVLGDFGCYIVFVNSLCAR